MKIEKIGDVPGNILGMLADCCHKLQHGKITPVELDLFLKRKNPFKEIDDKTSIFYWEKFYKKYFNIEVETSSVQIPSKPKGFDRLIVVSQGLTLNQLFSTCQKHFSCQLYADDLDKEVIQNDRDSKNGTYAIWVRDRQEADEENKNLSANRLKEQGAFGITLLERMIYELKYWDETGQHLDIKDWTLCSGSRFSGGHVPNASWVSGRFRVFWDDPDSRGGSLRSRSVVS